MFRQLSYNTLSRSPPNRDGQNRISNTTKPISGLFECILCLVLNSCKNLQPDCKRTGSSTRTIYSSTANTKFYRDYKHLKSLIYHRIFFFWLAECQSPVLHFIAAFQQHLFPYCYNCKRYLRINNERNETIQSDFVRCAKRMQRSDANRSKSCRRCTFEV